MAVALAQAFEAEAKRPAMKSCNPHNPTIAAVGAWWLSNIVIPAKAFHYGCAARRDERDGCPYTATLEWRKAAELFASNTRAAEYSWQQLERLMHLPRRLAGPIGISQQAAFPLAPASAQPRGCSIHRRQFGATNKVANNTARILKRSTLPAPAALIPQQTTPKEAPATI